MDSKDRELLATISTRCAKGDGFFKKVIDASIAGAEDGERYYREKAADMEIMASAMLSLVEPKRISSKLREKMSDLALSKLEKHNGKTSLNWSQQVDGAKNI